MIECFHENLIAIVRALVMKTGFTSCKESPVEIVLPVSYFDETSQFNEDLWAAEKKTIGSKELWPLHEQRLFIAVCVFTPMVLQ